MKNKLINRISHGIPITLYVISFLFTILLEIVNAQLDLNVMISIDFWIELAMKYTILVIVLAIMLPYFDSKFKEEKVYQEIKNKAQETNDKIVNRRLSNVYIDYTLEEMEIEEQKYYESLLNSCGKIDESYLDANLDFISSHYKEGKLNKDQFILLKKIKTGKLKFSKLNGTEIKYVGEYEVDERFRYRNSVKRVTLDEIVIKVISLFAVNIFLNILLNSLFKGDVTFKGSYLEIALSIVTTMLNYVTAIIYAQNVARKRVDENKRFTEVVTIFSSDFLEKIDTKMYVPKVTESVKEQLIKYNESLVEEEPEDELEMTQEEIDLILEKRKSI